MHFSVIFDSLNARTLQLNVVEINLVFFVWGWF